MSLSTIQASDELFGVCQQAWTNAQPDQVLAYVPKINYPGVIVSPPDVTQIYAEAHFSVVREHQIALTSVAGIKLYEVVGLFVLQVYSPKSDPTALRTAQIIATQVQDAFRAPSPSGEIWFKDQRCTTVPGSDTKNQVNVVATCTFKTAK